MHCIRYTNGLAWWGNDIYVSRHGVLQQRHGDEEVVGAKLELMAGAKGWSHGGFMEGVRTHLFWWPETQRGMVILATGEGDYSAVQQSMLRLFAQWSASSSDLESGQYRVLKLVYPPRSPCLDSAFHRLLPSFRVRFLTKAL